MTKIPLLSLIDRVCSNCDACSHNNPLIDKSDWCGLLTSTIPTENTCERFSPTESAIPYFAYLDTEEDHFRLWVEFWNGAFMEFGGFAGHTFHTESNSEIINAYHKFCELVDLDCDITEEDVTDGFVKDQFRKYEPEVEYPAVAYIKQAVWFDRCSGDNKMFVLQIESLACMARYLARKL